MASHETMSALFTSAPSAATDSTSHDEDCFQLDHDDHSFGEYSPMSADSHDFSSSHSSSNDDEDDHEGGISQSGLRARMSGLSIDGGPDDETGSDASPSPVGTGSRRRRRRAGLSSLSGRLMTRREQWVDKAWESRSGSASPDRDSGGCRLLLQPRGRRSMGRIRMDIEEVQACVDLGLELPGDCTVEISGSPTAAAAGSSPCSGNSSPRGGSGSWICSPGDDPHEIKARLKVWAHAVALASASRLSC